MTYRDAKRYDHRGMGTGWVSKHGGRTEHYKVDTVNSCN